jgi:hypothetical protein
LNGLKESVRDIGSEEMKGRRGEGEKMRRGEEVKR